MSSHVVELRCNVSAASCEPCRKSKIGCDRERPCGRCIKRGLRHLCVYRAVRDRSTKTTTASKHFGDRSRPGLEHRLKQIERSLQDLQRNLPSATSSTGEAHADKPNLEDGLDTLNIEDHTVVAAVATAVSNTSVLQEFFSAHEQLKEIFDSLPLGQASPPSSWRQEAPAAESKRFWQSRLELSTTVLAHFPSLPLCNDLVRVYFEGFYQIRPIVPRHWIDQILNEIFQLQGLAEPRTTNDIADAATRIDYGSGDRLSGCTSTSLLDWNTIGVLLCVFAIAAYTTPQLLDVNLLAFHEEILLPDEIRAFAFKMKDLVGVCWQLSDPHEQANESLVLFLYFYFMLHVVFGEVGPFVGHLYGCLIRASATIGLHHESSKAGDVRSDIQRRRCEYAAVYHLDKIYATFKAHPPLMFRRFATTPLPDAATEAHSYLRGQFLVAVAREEVLEWIMTSPRSPQKADVQRIQDIVHARYDSIPSEQKYDSNTPVTIEDPCLYAHRIILYLFSLETSFLLQNAVKKKQGVLPESQLLKTSLAMFSTVVRTSETRGQLSQLAFIISWLLMTYASASAGIVYASILRQQTKPSSSTDVLSPPLTSRAHHLHQLQLFLQALSTVEATDPWFESCQKAFSIFSRVNEVLLERETIKPPDDGAAVVGSIVSDVVDSHYSSGKDLLFGLESNSMDFVTLPWFDYVWRSSEDALLSQSGELVGFESVMVDQPTELASGMDLWT